MLFDEGRQAAEKPRPVGRVQRRATAERRPWPARRRHRSPRRPAVVELGDRLLGRGVGHGECHRGNLTTGRLLTSRCPTPGRALRRQSPEKRPVPGRGWRPKRPRSSPAAKKSDGCSRSDCRPVATPAPLLGPLADPGANRIQHDVARGFQEVRVLRDRPPRVVVPEEMTRPSHACGSSCAHAPR